MGMFDPCRDIHGIVISHIFMLIDIKGNIDFVVSGVLTCLLGTILGQGYSTLVIKKYSCMHILSHEVSWREICRLTFFIMSTA